MAIKLEFYDLIVPIKTIKKKYPGGWEQCLKDHDGDIGGRVWYDEHLFRDGAMSPNDIGNLVEWWSEKGFDAHDEGEKPKWLDVCGVQSIFGGPTLPCEWIEVNHDNFSGIYKNTPDRDLLSSEINESFIVELYSR